jgi:hypothetical protein
MTYPNTDDVEVMAAGGEPSHVHIPRPSRQTRGFTSDSASDARRDTSAMPECSCADD